MRKLRVEEMGRLDVEGFKVASKKPLIVVLDNVRSMHNVGSVFRTADAFLLQKIWLCGITPRPPHREIRKTAIGATESVNWEYCEEIIPLIQKLRAEDWQILSLEQAEGSTLLHEFPKDSQQKYALVIGHEIDGVSQEVIDLSHACLEIPQFGTKHSLNVSVAAGIAICSLVV